MKYLLLFLPLMLTTPGLSAQGIQLSGVVVDEESREALPFVNILINNSNRGCTTDIDGKFSIRFPDSIRFNYDTQKALIFNTWFILRRILPTGSSGMQLTTGILTIPKSFLPLRILPTTK